MVAPVVVERVSPRMYDPVLALYAVGGLVERMH